MPYNVNPPCPTGQKTVINWQFSGQALKTNDQGDDYKITYKTAQAYTDYNIFFDFTFLQGGKTPFRGYVCGDKATAVSQNSAYGKILNFRINNPTNFTYVAVFWEAEYPNGNIVQSGTNFSFFDPAHPDLRGPSLVYFDSCGFSLMAKDVRNIRFVPFNQGVNSDFYVIDIYKNGVVIQSDSGSSVPIVNYQCSNNQCPPNTCDVLCGDTICCYNSEGISVFNYPNV